MAVFLSAYSNNSTEQVAIIARFHGPALPLSIAAHTFATNKTGKKKPNVEIFYMFHLLRISVSRSKRLSWGVDWLVQCHVATSTEDYTTTIIVFLIGNKRCLIAPVLGDCSIRFFAVLCHRRMPIPPPAPAPNRLHIHQIGSRAGSRLPSRK
jgi:hypothetical protein